MKCKVCGTPTERPKYCSEKCQKKAWKLYNREKYLAGKLKYRKSHKRHILAYNKLWKGANPEKVKMHRKKHKEAKNGDKNS